MSKIPSWFLVLSVIILIALMGFMTWTLVRDTVSLWEFLAPILGAVIVGGGFTWVALTYIDRRDRREASKKD
jgi:hypothetical protein